MRRWVFAFLLLVVPLQLVWAAAAPYCGHESSTAAKKHFGHHEHQHEAGGNELPPPDEGAGGSRSDHVDCESCRLACAVTLLVPVVSVGAPLRAPLAPLEEHSYRSHVPSGPERPDRSETAPAARFGGGAVFVSLTD